MRWIGLEELTTRLDGARVMETLVRFLLPIMARLFR